MYECAFSYKNIKVKLCHVLTRGPSCPWRHYCPLNHKKIDDFTCFANKTAFINKIIITINWHEWKLPKCVWSFNLHTLHTQRRSVTSGAGLCECKTAASRGQQKPSVVPLTAPHEQRCVAACRTPDAVFIQSPVSQTFPARDCAKSFISSIHSSSTRSLSVQFAHRVKTLSDKYVKLWFVLVIFTNVSLSQWYLHKKMFSVRVSSLVLII